MAQEKCLTGLPYTPFSKKTGQASPPVPPLPPNAGSQGCSCTRKHCPPPPQRQGTALASGEEGGPSRTSFLLRKLRAEEGRSPPPRPGASSQSQSSSLKRTLLFGAHTVPFQSTATGVLSPAGDRHQVPGRDPGHDLTQVLPLTRGSRAQAGKSRAQHTSGAFSFHG